MLSVPKDLNYFVIGWRLFLQKLKVLILETCMRRAKSRFSCLPGNVQRDCQYTYNLASHAIMVLISQAISKGSGEPAHSRSLARAFAVRTHDIWKYTKGPTKSQTSRPTRWLRMCVFRMSFRRTKSIIIP